MTNQDIQNEFSEDQGQALLRFARFTIGEKLGITEKNHDQKEIIKSLENEIFNKNSGVFVTLNMDGNLRGCIGSLESRESVKQGVARNAVNAAFHDPRFPKLTKDEFARVHMEVSILSEPSPLEYTDSEELLSKLKAGIHGVIIKKGGAQATFLPQVWEQLPDKTSFMSHLCRKAGLYSEEWKKGKLKVMTYTVQYFEEGE
ncbi:conserved hypothetical protein [Desulfamplus magnetovallimortis]|uniref:AMMECR1 domain-containing protein n=1 Tax=Desulfamplus magnetovallimortis TaxID=1246637 RepID=A0A1W1HFN3_9BACT|nr:AmmeMemoRadiSam system protein A [Desulfamplus magnetovallimortis]SLM31294.1 conserved hypothetical protein [Desulfamplus magnetovallimortis]